MKLLYLPILLLIMLISFIQCREEYTFEAANDAEAFMHHLKEGKEINYMEIPPFTAEVIPTLLQYSTDTQVIQNFPRNPISSAYFPDCTVGQIALWTIESIRLYSQASTDIPIGRFPSLNPSLRDIDQENFTPEERERIQLEAAKAYQEWWQQENHISIPDLMLINPLQETKYVWR